MNFNDVQKLWDEFLVNWPLEKVRAMTLEEYSKSGDQNNFTYWIERKTKPIANILGGSAFKFGIYHRSATDNLENNKGKIYQDDYAWSEKYGDSKERVFNEVKKRIIQTIEYAQSGNLTAIDEIDFSPVVKWKIAFLYQNQERPAIISIFSRSMLDFLTGNYTLKYSEIYNQLIQKMGTQSLLEYSFDLVEKYVQAHPKQSHLTPSEVDEILSVKYPDKYKSRQKMTLVTNDNGREIGLVLEGKKTSFFIQVDPENNGVFQFEFSRKKDGSVAKYSENDTRHASLDSLSEYLKVGFKTYHIQIDTLDEFEKFCDWYESENISNHSSLAKNEEKHMKYSQNNHPLNQILFGPAGTGKTYHTVNHALQIIDPDFYEVHKAPEQRDILKQEFQKYVDNGQIQFVTFHQSFSYEDFVEGIRAETVDGSLTYKIQSGVFKALAKSANIVGAEFKKDHYILCANGSCIDVKKPNGNIVTLSAKLVEFLLSNVKDQKITIEDISSKNIINILGEHAILEPFIVNGYNNLLASLVDFLIQLPSQKSQNSEPVVLIIDEINRGNISRIFGELITLIEDSKRQGNTEELSTILPYSKEQFSVPNNLYIIGTMNSSDRSLTGLDLALRRRFTFIEMLPNPSLLSGVEVQIGTEEKGIQIDRLLDIINQRIEILLDRDHCIGHAYFMPLKDKPELSVLREIFLQKIIPLLQEYFFDDWEHIHAVLNENGMLKKKYDASKVSKLFKNQKSNRDIWEVNTQAFDNLNAYKAIYAGIDLEVE
ncbi:MAG: AAA family ATPase [Acinetobacter junii]|nr:AAA family ATPase [Acinetobacter junii]